MVIPELAQSGGKFESPLHVDSELRWNQVAQYCEPYPSRGLFNASFFTFLCFLLVILQLEMAELSAQVLSSVLKCKKAVMWGED